MKVLFLTSRFPYPPFRGDKLKMFNLIRQLSGHHEVVLLSFVEETPDQSWLGEVSRYCSSVTLVRLSPVQSLFNCLRAIPGRVPFQVAYFSSSSMQKVLHEVLQRERPDLVHTHLIRLAKYVSGLNETPRILDLTDAVSLYLKRFRETTRNLLLRGFLRVELYRMLHYEGILSSFDRVLVCSEVDRDVLNNHVPGLSIDILRNGVDLEVFKDIPDTMSVADRIIFTGNMSYYPNVDAARFFVQEILPRVRSVIPAAKVYLVGQNPSRAVRSLASEAVIVTGFVPDIRLEYLKSTVAVSPVRFGAGTLNKVLEPIALGIPVVATPLSVEGLDLRIGEEIFVADDPEYFADRVVKLLKDTSLRTQVGRAATARVRRLHGWESVAGQLMSIYEDVLSRSKT